MPITLIVQCAMPQDSNFISFLSVFLQMNLWCQVNFVENIFHSKVRTNLSQIFKMFLLMPGKVIKVRSDCPKPFALDFKEQISNITVKKLLSQLKSWNFLHVSRCSLLRAYCSRYLIIVHYLLFVACYLYLFIFSLVALAFFPLFFSRCLLLTDYWISVFVHYFLLFSLSCF